MTDIKRLANKINSYFVGLTDHFPPLCQGVPPLSVRDEILISEYEAYKSLSSLQTSKAVGPDNKPNRILKDFALELAPLVCGMPVPKGGVHTSSSEVWFNWLSNNCKNWQILKKGA